MPQTDVSWCSPTPPAEAPGYVGCLVVGLVHLASHERVVRGKSLLLLNVGEQDRFRVVVTGQNTRSAPPSGSIVAGSVKLSIKPFSFGSHR